MDQRIRFGKPIEPTLPLEKPPSVHLLIAPPLRSPGTPPDRFSLYVSKRVLEEVWDYVAENSSVEVGGILVGHPFRDLDYPVSTFVVIVGAIRQESDNHSIGHFAVSPPELAQTRSIMENRYPGLTVVGWYHSHPGHGVFLSSWDMQIVRSIYDAMWNVALVVDPVRGEYAFFLGPEGRRLPTVALLAFDKIGDYQAIQAVAIYNCMREAQIGGDSKLAEMFRNRLQKLVSGSVELLHWQDQGFYQDVHLTAVVESYQTESDVPTVTSDNALKSTAPFWNDLAEKVFLEAITKYNARNYNGTVHSLALLKSHYPEYRSMEVDKILEECERCIESSRQRRIRGPYGF